MPCPQACVDYEQCCRFVDVEPNVSYVEEEDWHPCYAQYNMCCVEHAVAPSSNRSQCGRSNGRENPEASYAADDVAFPDLGKQQIGLDGEVEVEKCVEREEKADYAAKELMVDIECFVRTAGEQLDW